MRKLTASMIQTNTDDVSSIVMLLVVWIVQKLASVGVDYWHVARINDYIS